MKDNVQDAAWDEWFELQYGLCRELDQWLDQALSGKSRPLKAAAQAALLEHLAERIRTDIDLPGRDRQVQQEVADQATGP